MTLIKRNGGVDCFLLRFARS